MKLAGVVESLRKLGRVQVSGILETRGMMPVKDYSAWLNQYQVPCPLEPELRDAFDDELKRLDYTPVRREEFTNELEQTRILQTATHVTATEGPTFFAIHWMASLGIEAGSSYPVAAFSGVPFSNNAWSGCLNYSNRHSLEQLYSSNSPFFYELDRAQKDRMRDLSASMVYERRISLIPGVLRDALVYQTIVPRRMQQLLLHLSPNLSSLFPPVQAGTSFSRWAIRSCQNLSQSLLKQTRMVCLDLNEVITSYLQTKLFQPGHPISQLFFDTRFQARVLQEFGPDLSVFSAPYREKNREKIAALRIRNNCLESPWHRFELTPESLIDALKTRRLCPGIFLTFMILSFLNGFKCLGSFEQIEYLSGFQQKWVRTGLLDQETVRHVATNGLNAGRFIDDSGVPVYPLDIILGTPWNFPEEKCMQDLILPLIKRLLEIG